MIRHLLPFCNQELRKAFMEKHSKEFANISQKESDSKTGAAQNGSGGASKNFMKEMQDLINETPYFDETLSLEAAEAKKKHF